MNTQSDTYLLQNDAARRLYHRVKGLPIVDFHCHLSPKEMVEDRPYDNIGEMWLAGDHYKWRLMRAAGVEERFVTGDAPWREKFQKYAETLCLCAGNPIYQWSHMELSRYFGIDTVLNGQTAEEIWQKSGEVIRQKRLSPKQLIRQSNVAFLATTDDIADPLPYHERLAADASFPAKVTPTFRADNLFLMNDSGYREYLKRLEKAAGVTIRDMDSLLTALENRLNYFADHGCRLADVGCELFPDEPAGKAEAEQAFQSALCGEKLSEKQVKQFTWFVLCELAARYHKRGVAMQLHLAVKRNANTLLSEQLGRDVGGDCIGDPITVRTLTGLLDQMHSRGGLPKTILYALPESMNAALSGIAGCYPGVVCGAAWWYQDHKDGIAELMKTIAATGNLSTFPGMVTDSRSFLSYARHDFFRRILCSVVGEWIEAGEFCEDENAVLLLTRLCCGNAMELAGLTGKEDVL